MPDKVRLRLFFALWPEASVRQALVRATRPWVRAAGGRPVPAEKLHVTLAFLGSVPAGDLDKLKSAAASVAATPFELVLDKLGFFRRARTVWLGSSAVDPALTTLEQDLWRVLEAAGWSREARPFTPHVTLVRKANGLPEAAAVRPVAWPVGYFSLIESVTDRRGAIYQELERWPLTSA